MSNGQDHTGPLCARDYKGVGNEYVSEGKVIATCSDGSESSADLRDRGMGAAGNWIYPVTISDGSKWVVRRLTPTECERLMGFPDGWTDIGEWEDEKGRRRKCADGNRYKALGNSMAVTVMMWLGARIQMVESLKERL